MNPWSSLLTIATTLLAVPAVADARLDSHARGIWSIAGPAGHARWVVIHDLAKAKATGIYHIEVIQRAEGAPAWQVERLAGHMAITEAALARSVIRPLDRGAVYPEPFDDAYRRWQAENQGRGGGVCTTTVQDCLAH